MESSAGGAVADSGEVAARGSTSGTARTPGAGSGRSGRRRIPCEPMTMMRRHSASRDTAERLALITSDCSAVGVGLSASSIIGAAGTKTTGIVLAEPAVAPVTAASLAPAAA